VRRRRLAATTATAVLAAACGMGSAMSGSFGDDAVTAGGGATTAGDTVVVVVDGEDGDGPEVVGFTDDGAERWRWGRPGAALSPSPVAGDDVAVVTFATPPPGDGTPAGVCAVDAADGTERWCVEVDDPAFGRTGRFAPTLAVAGAVVVAADAGGTVRALDLADGTTRWTTTVAEPPDGEPREPGDLLVVGDLVVGSVGAEDSVVALDLDGGAERWRADVGTWRRAGHGLAGAGDAIVVQGTDEVVLLDRGDGQLRWRTPLPPPPAGEHAWPDAVPLVVDDTVLVVSTVTPGEPEARVLYALDLPRGEVRWARPDLPPPAAPVRDRTSALAAVDGRVLLLSGELVVVDLADGELSPQGVTLPWTQRPAVVDGELALVDRDRRLRRVELP
jgi:outer membrane protein assembly factor BamB